MFKYLEFDEKIRNMFDEEELKQILKKAALYSKKVIYLSLNCGSIEISADLGDKLDMVWLAPEPDAPMPCMVLTKQELFDILEDCEVEKVTTLTINE